MKKLIIVLAVVAALIFVIAWVKTGGFQFCPRDQVVRHAILRYRTHWFYGGNGLERYFEIKKITVIKKVWGNNSQCEGRSCFFATVDMTVRYKRSYGISSNTWLREEEKGIFGWLIKKPGAAGTVSKNRFTVKIVKRNGHWMMPYRPW